jgi:hypothetical protein
MQSSPHRHPGTTHRRIGVARRALVRTALAAAVLAVAALAAALLGGCPPTVPEVQRLPRYRALLGLPLEQRVLPADEAVLERAHRTNRDYGQDIRPRAASLEHPLAPIVRAVLADLPPRVKRLAAPHLAAVYLVEDDVGSATTEGVQDASGAWRHAYVVLNLSALQRDANAWATWKEASAFRPSEGYALRMIVEPPEGDDRAGAVRFILLHELGHVLGLALGVHSFWDDPTPLPPGATRLSPFAALSWELRSEDASLRVESRHAAREPALHAVRFYRFAKAPHALAEAAALYAALERTDFPSLYGTRNVYEDIAEAFAVYVHTVLLERPYQVELLRDGQVRHTYRSCIASGACPDKIRQVRALIEAGPPPHPGQPGAEPGTETPTTGRSIRLGIGAGVGIRR